MFIPAIIYMAAKGIVIAAGDGHGMVQTVGQLAIESIMLILLIWARPYSLKSGNVINIVIQTIRVLSVLCILVFVEQLGISQTPKTVTGVVLIVMQSVLTGVLAILIAVNALIVMCRMNPHRKARKEAEKLNRDMDNLTPLDARNSLLLNPGEYKGGATKDPLDHASPMVLEHPVSPPRHTEKNAYGPGYVNDDDASTYRGYHRTMESQHSLLSDDRSISGQTLRTAGSNPSMRQPLLPAIDTRYHQHGY